MQKCLVVIKFCSTAILLLSLWPSLHSAGSSTFVIPVTSQHIWLSNRPTKVASSMPTLTAFPCCHWNQWPVMRTNLKSTSPQSTPLPDPAVFKREQRRDKGSQLFVASANGYSPTGIFVFLEIHFTRTTILLLALVFHKAPAALPSIKSVVTQPFSPGGSHTHFAVPAFTNQACKTTQHHVTVCTQCQWYKNPTAASTGQHQPEQPQC